MKLYTRPPPPGSFLNICFEALINIFLLQMHKDMADFDNHLDDITQDYLNVQINMVIDQEL